MGWLSRLFGSSEDENQTPVWPEGCEDMNADAFAEECARHLEEDISEPAQPEIYTTQSWWQLLFR